MPHRDVPFRAGEYYHVYNRGNNRQPIFFERENYLFLLRRLREYLTSSRAAAGPAAQVIAYCLMPNHYHLLVRLCRDDFSQAMQSFGQSYANAINKRYKRVGSLFQGRFQAVHVEENAYLLHLSRYIHLNPVMAGLVDAPEAWDFSSYPEYAGMRTGSLPHSEIVLSQFCSRQAYCRFVHAGIGSPNERISHLLFDEA